MSDAETAPTPVHLWEDYPGVQGSKLFHEYLTRLTSNRDMHVIVTAAAETGVGKTTLAVVLALLWDVNGWTADNATLNPNHYEVMYDDVDPGSVLILDEVQNAVDARRGGAKDNVSLSQAFAQKRYRQVCGIMTAPSKGWVDGRIGEDSADYWIQALETPEGKPKGEAKVYRLRNNEHYETSYTKRTETISWPVMDSHPEMKRLHRKKVRKDRGETDEKYIRVEEHRSEMERAKKDLKRDRDDFWMEWAYENTDATQEQIGDAIGISQSGVHNRINGK